MAQPPPSGPSQPPYQPYPQQPYPPQYPPQPYYAPAAPPPREDRTLLYIALAVIVVIVIIAVLAVYFFVIAVNTASSFTKITITGVSFTVQYNNATASYFGNQITTCSVCPFTVSLYTQFTYTLRIHNNGAFDHTVNSIGVSGPNFQLTGVSPTLPAIVAGATTTDFTLTIQPSTLAGSYTLAGTVTTSS